MPAAPSKSEVVFGWLKSKHAMDNWLNHVDITLRADVPSELREDFENHQANMADARATYKSAGYAG